MSDQHAPTLTDRPRIERTVSASESTGTAVKRMIAELEECELSHLGTLSQAVDVDRLESLVASSPSGDGDSQSIQFRYCGYAVEVWSDRTVTVEP